MKKIGIFFLLMLFLVSCAKIPEGEELKKVLEERYESGRRTITLEELVGDRWDQVWLVNSFDEGVILPQALENLKPAEKPRLILIKDGELHSFALPGDGQFLYPKTMYVTAFELYPESEFLIDKQDGTLRLLYQELCPV